MFKQGKILAFWSTGYCLPGESDLPVYYGRMRTLLRNPFLYSCPAPSAISCPVEIARRTMPIIARVSSALTLLQSWQGGLSASSQGLLAVLLTGSSVDNGCPFRPGDVPLSRRWDPRPFHRIVFERAHHASRARTSGDPSIAISSSAVRFFLFFGSGRCSFRSTSFLMQSACLVVGASTTLSTHFLST